MEAKLFKISDGLIIGVWWLLWIKTDKIMIVWFGRTNYEVDNLPRNSPSSESLDRGKSEEKKNIKANNFIQLTNISQKL